MSFLDNIKLIASELANMSPKTQLEIVKLCKNLCIEAKNYLVAFDETTLPALNNHISQLDTHVAQLDTLYDNLSTELETAEGNISANANAIELLQGSVEAITEALSGIYTKSQVDALLSAKANSADVYTKTQIDNLLMAKADASDVYTKSQADTLLNGKADKTDTYTKSQVDTALSAKANSADVYTKTEVDTALSGKQNTLIDSGTNQNIKTINNQSILGSGNIDIQGGGGSLYMHNIHIYLHADDSVQDCDCHLHFILYSTSSTPYTALTLPNLFVPVAPYQSIGVEVSGSSTAVYSYKYNNGTHTLYFYSNSDFNEDNISFSSNYVTDFTVTDSVSQM